MDGNSLFWLQIWAILMTGVAAAVVFLVTGWQDGGGAPHLGITTAQLLLLLAVPFGGGALAVWVLWLNRPEDRGRSLPMPSSSRRNAHGESERR